MKNLMFASVFGSILSVASANAQSIGVPDVGTIVASGVGLNYCEWATMKHADGSTVNYGVLLTDLEWKLPASDVSQIPSMTVINDQMLANMAVLRTAQTTGATVGLRSYAALGPIESCTDANGKIIVMYQFDTPHTPGP